MLPRTFPSCGGSRFCARYHYFPRTICYSGIRACRGRTFRSPLQSLRQSLARWKTGTKAKRAGLPTMPVLRYGPFRQIANHWHCSRTQTGHTTIPPTGTHQSPFQSPSQKLPLKIQNNPLRDMACASLRSPASSFTAFGQNDQTPNGQGRDEPPAKQVHKKDREQYAQNQIGNERDHLSTHM